MKASNLKIHAISVFASILLISCLIGCAFSEPIGNLYVEQIDHSNDPEPGTPEYTTDFAVKYHSDILTVTSSNRNGFFDGHKIHYIPVRKSLEFPKRYIDIPVGDVVRIRNMCTRALNPFLIHSADNEFDDYTIRRNFDMYIQFDEPGTYTIELYNASASKDDDLVPFNKNGPSVLVVTVE